MKKLASIIGILVSLFFVLTGCDQPKTFDIASVKMTASDKIDVPAGIYQLEYSIENWSELVKVHGATLEITVKNKANQPVVLTGNQITVEVDEVYLVTLTVTIDDETVSKNFYVHAITSSQLLYTVTFDVQGGIGSFEDQEVIHGGIPNLPETEPTKEGYIFTGWFYDATLTEFCDFAEPIYANTILYAGYEVLGQTYTITYDLNGAPQSGTITETVKENDTLEGMSVTPVREGYRLEGFSLTPSGDVLYDFDTPVQNSFTLYAIWLFNYDEIEYPSYFTNIDVYDNSMFDDVYQINQIMTVQAYIDVFNFKQAKNLQESMTEFGVLYGETNALSYQQRGILKVSDVPFSGNVPFIDYLFNTEALKETTTYYARLYLRFEETILYSDVQSFETIHVVKGGSSVGLSGVVSGGEYYISEPQIGNHSVFYYEVLTGYEAKDNLNSYQSYSHISSQGTHRIIVTDLATNEQYLHLYKLKFDKPFVNSKWFYTQVLSPSTVKLQFTLTLLHEDRYTYNITDGGVLYSKNTFALMKGVPTVHDVDADYNASNGLLSTTDSLSFDDRESYYVRSYVVVNSKIHYSNIIYVMTYEATEQVYQASIAFSVSETTTDISYPYDYYVGSGIQYLHYFDGTSVQKSTYSGNGSFISAGDYFSNPEGTTYMNVVHRIGTYPPLTGVTMNAIYTEPVLINLDMANAYMYMSYNGGAYVDLPHLVRLEQTGTYEVFYRTATGMTSVYFEIK